MAQWNAFNLKNKLYIQPSSLESVTTSIREFVMPLMRSEIMSNERRLRGGAIKGLDRRSGRWARNVKREGLKNSRPVASATAFSRTQRNRVIIVEYPKQP